MILLYCLLSADKKSTYVGITTNLARRLRAHNGWIRGGAKSTRRGRPWSVAWSKTFSSDREARSLEAAWHRSPRCRNPHVTDPVQKRLHQLRAVAARRERQTV